MHWKYSRLPGALASLGPRQKGCNAFLNWSNSKKSYLGLYYAKSYKWITRQHVWPVTHSYSIYPMQWTCNPLVFGGEEGEAGRGREKETIRKRPIPLQNSPRSQDSCQNNSRDSRDFYLGFPPPHAGFSNASLPPLFKVSVGESTRSKRDLSTERFSTQSSELGGLLGFPTDATKTRFLSSI